MLKLHRAERTNTLVTALAEILAVPMPDPFAAEIVAVPARGVERWVTQQLSSVLGTTARMSGDGIAANIEFPSPAALVDGVIGCVGGGQSASVRYDDDDPWSAGRMLWTLLSVIDDAADDPVCAILARHLGRSGPDRGRPGFRIGRRYGTAEHLTQLFRGYATHRPQMIVDWARGADTDGSDQPLGPELLWQPHLWRLLRARIDNPSPPERLDDVCALIRQEPDLVDLPPRVALFGATRLSTEQLQVLAALGVHREVNLFLPHASPALWDKVRANATVRRRREMVIGDVDHPLLASLSREVRELQMRLTPFIDEDVHHPAGPTAGTHLTQLQEALREDRVPTGSMSPDGSIEVHSCHGAARQVEVLRELILHLFQDDTSLDPRDVIVMCPDVETYAPLIRAAFGQTTHLHPGHELRVRLADRALRQTNPLLEVMSELLTLAGGRVKASEVLGLAESAPVRARFDFSDDDLERLREWTAESGARWGINDNQRKPFGLGGFAQNTFSAGLDRILLGVVADETELSWLGTALPLDDVDSADVDLAGRFAEFVSRLDSALATLRGPRPAAEWAQNISAAMDLLTAVRPADSWQRGQAHQEVAAATEHGSEVVVRLADIRAMLSRRLAGRPTRANFRTGELTVCTMVPMRAVPHRVVILLGLDDESYPRAGGGNGDDILASDPWVGERDIRSEDRQLLLDATMSAVDRLIVLYTGNDPVTGLRRPPAVPVGELLDAANGMLATGSVLTVHPLHAFDPANFVVPAPFSFDRSALAGARATRGVQVAEPQLLSDPLPPRAGDVELAELIAFVEHPMRAFCRQRLGLYLPGDEEELDDVLSAEIGGLDKWSIGDRMLAARLAGVDAAALRAGELRRGTLPPFRLGGEVFRGISDDVEALVAAAEPLYEGSPESFDVTVDLAGGRRLTGTVTGVHDGVLVRTVFSRLAAKHRVAAWVNLLALAAAEQRDWSAVVVGRARFGNRLQRSRLTPPADPGEILQQIVDLRDRGLRAPLPLPTAAGAEYAARRYRGDDDALALDAAEKSFDNQYGGEAQDLYVRYLFGGVLTAVTAAEPDAGERAWDQMPTRFAASAVRLWNPVLDAEKVN
ncbi:exodeoxyribonuclease V subunit gamma [Williamsia soli]|uniref:exodeoxyribonuclease V subunit gamma n=1 Tax=Williamsia soli TaxID=364929 RepID=UPI001A9FD8C8|nr:exodeoxyribonuclease V subunit gamma [Williamsia soli]